MPISIECPKCHRTLKIPDTLTGKQGRCPACCTVIVVPPARAAVGVAGNSHAPPSPAGGPDIASPAETVPTGRALPEWKTGLALAAAVLLLLAVMVGLGLWWVSAQDRTYLREKEVDALAAAVKQEHKELRDAATGAVKQEHKELRDAATGDDQDFTFAQSDAKAAAKDVAKALAAYKTYAARHPMGKHLKDVLQAATDLLSEEVLVSNWLEAGRLREAGQSSIPEVGEDKPDGTKVTYLEFLGSLSHAREYGMQEQPSPERVLGDRIEAGQLRGDGYKVILLDEFMPNGRRAQYADQLASLNQARDESRRNEILASAKAYYRLEKRGEGVYVWRWGGPRSPEQTADLVTVLAIMEYAKAMNQAFALKIISSSSTDQQTAARLRQLKDRAAWLRTLEGVGLRK
jgi:hypothetical protein